MKWFIVIMLVVILAVPFISGVNYLRKNDLKIFKHPAKEDLKEEKLLGSDEVNSFRVAQIQNALKSFGVGSGVIDGKLGKNTRESIKKFQIAKGIFPSGKIDSRTYFELLENPRIETKQTETAVLAEKQKADLESKNIAQNNAASEENKTVENLPETTVKLQPKAAIQNNKFVKKSKVDRRVDLKYFQSVLKRLGLYKGKVDGIAGKKTCMAIKKYQKTHRLKADGILGYMTKLCLSREG